LQTQTKQKRLYAIAFGMLAALVGTLAGGPALPMMALGGAFAALYVLAERRSWLLAAPNGWSGREYAVTGVFAVLAVLFVVLTGGLRSPMPCTLYLPVLLASLCYGMRLGLTASAVMVGVASVLALDGSLPQAVPSLRAMAIGLSFPVVALFGGTLRAQMEDRLRTLDSEKKALSAQLDMSQMMESAFDLDMTLNLILLNVQEHSGCHVCAVYLMGADQTTLELRSASGPRVDMSQMMESAFDLDMTLNLILLNVQEHSGCHVCAVYLMGADQTTLELRSASGPRDRTPLLPALAVEEARAAGWAVTDAAHFNQDVRAFYAPDRQAGVSRLFEIDGSAGSFACLPLASFDGLLGMLYVGYAHPQGLMPEEIERLEHLALWSAFPLRRVLLQQDFRLLAYSDSMTGLDNFRQFEKTLAEELSRAERYSRPLSVILLDIDHFKFFNDTLGHQAGDALLGQLGVVLRNALRNVDKPARYGGEEFVIICPETGAEEARLIAERIRRNVADTPFVLPSKDDGGNPQDRSQDRRGVETVHVTISLGCVTFPTDAHTPRDLVKKADIALYAAKEAGRNAVRVYGEDGARVKAA